LKLIEIERNLKKYLPKGSDTVKKAMRYSVLSGGKRIRPMLAIEASKACAGTLKTYMPVACAIEFIHTYSLIHDDLRQWITTISGAENPSCHKMFGDANAILPEMPSYLAFDIIANNARPARALIS